MARSGRPENSAGQMSMFPTPVVPPEAKREPDGELVRPRKPTQTTHEQRVKMHQDQGVKGAATVESRWDLEK